MFQQVASETDLSAFREHAAQRRCLIWCVRTVDGIEWAEVATSRAKSGYIIEKKRLCLTIAFQMLPEAAGIDAKRSYKMNILHITDLHFGTDRSITERDERHLALEELIVTVQGLDPSWAPSVVCVSGDLAFAGRPSDYSQFGDWIKRLLSALNLGVERLVVCPGNHDIERAVATTFARAGTPEEADRCLSVPLAAHYEKAFQNYTQSCKALGIPSLAFGDQESYLTGVRVLDGVRFVSMNSSWFCRDNTDHQQLWIGILLLRHLEASNQWPKQDIPCIGLLHHPREDFNPQEIHAYGNRPNVYDYICERCDILLSGHTHGEVREPDQIAGRALVFTGGATYVGSDYNNSFQILRLQGNSLDYRAFVFDPRKRNWMSAGEAKHRHLGSPAISSGLDTPAPAPIEDWRSKAAGDARRVRDSKSRAASPSGNLPPLIQRGVTILRVETKGLSPEQAKVSDRSESFPLYNAIRTSPGRKVLLLGDIGSGKSTLVCEFVERSLSESPTSLAFIVPATSLSVSPNLTLKALLGQVSAYFSEEIAPTSDALNIQAVLGQGTEVTLAIDGLDEMSVSSASLLLSKLGTATEHWSNLQIVATSRPIELQGIDYQTWNVLSTLSVNAAERLELLQNELTSLGSTRNIYEEAEELESQIARSETVSALFSSPLTIRLFTPVLRKSGVSATVTLGELLLDVLNERLSGWNQRDLKPHQFSALEAALPSPDSRLRLLGEALASIPEESDTRRDVFISRFEASSTLAANPAKGSVAKEAFDSLVLAGILSNASVVSFPLQAFREMCVAYWLVQKLDDGSEQEIMGSRWRDVSFAAAVLRRSNSFSDYRDVFDRYIASLLRDVSGVFAAASVVLESQDQHLSLSFIEGLKKLGQHPFNRSGGIDRDDSSKAVAASLRLAGNAGFDWFFNEYLNPRYPVRYAGSAILDWVFAEWLAQVRDTLTAEQLDKLKTLVRPHIDASTFQVHGIVARLSTVVPEAFSCEERVYFASALLADMRYRVRALEAIDREFASDPATTESLLVGRINQGFNDGGLIAAILIDRQPGVPPLDLIRAVLRSATSSRINKTVEAALATIKDRLTEPTWLRLLRWLTFDSDRSVAASAGIFANDIEPQPSELIRKPLLDALHDGAYVWRAEPLLRKAVEDGGTGQVHWLANEIARADRMMGGHSGWWRIFLANLEKTGTDAPVVLADALGGLGPFLLARNPEIRQRFKELLQGTHGDAYRTELRSQLDAVEPRVRLAAAAILTTCDPKGEARALRVAVRAQDEWRTHDWHEWFDMALTFSYGPGPLTALEAELLRFGDSAKSYAFRLLFQNNTGIETRQAGVAIPAAMVTMIKNLANAGDTALADKELIAAVTGQVGGLATAAANAPGGGLIQLQNALTSLGTYIGNDLIPPLDAMAKAIEPIITDVSQWAEAHPQLTDAIIAGVVAFTGLILVITVVGIAIIALGSTFALAAVGISALVAIIVGVVVANWNTIKTITEQVIGAITAVWDPFWTELKMIAQVATEAISEVLQFEFGNDVQIVTTGFNTIKSIWTDSLNFVETTWKTAWTDMSDFLGSIWSTIQNTVKTGVDYVIQAINAFINALDAIHILIPSISIPGTKLATPAINLGFTIPDVPMLAEGGFVNSPTLAIIGEAGPEAVIPLSGMGGGGGGVGGGQQIVVNINGGIFPADPSAIKQIADLLAKSITQQLRVRNYQP
jgi:hypothetical protein